MTFRRQWLIGLRKAAGPDLITNECDTLLNGPSDPPGMNGLGNIRVGVYIGVGNAANAGMSSFELCAVLPTQPD
jgi:hypothetical protein